MYHIYRNDGKHGLYTYTINIPGKQKPSMFSIVEKNTKIFIAIDEIGMKRLTGKWAFTFSRIGI